MPTLHLDPSDDDALRRRRLYAGDVYVYTPRPEASALCAFAKEMIAEAFYPLAPERAQDDLPVERYAAILAELKPAFIHHPESKRRIRALLTAFGCDPERTYFDVPRMRSSTSDAYLTTGIAYAFHPHRDTWYSAPACQLNWWLPIYDLEPASGMAFHLQYWGRPVKNGSRSYNYAEWNRVSRFNAAQHIGTDTRVQPKPEQELDLAGELDVRCQAGGLLVFSAAQLHSSIENRSGRTRFSIDFRTVHRDDVEAGAGAPNVDSECTGTTMGDYLRCTDLAHLPDEWIERYDQGYGR
jgi:hypothetical protein